ncbi:MAG: hypothetical protein JWQ11_2199 [Rhizobacter sp.]|nr:hypothetical protein [Rhizobacter sp.]
MPALRYLAFELSEGAEGVTTLEAVASTRADVHAAVISEAEQVLGWAWRTFADSHGAVEDGLDWDHDLSVRVEDGQWHTVALTFSGSDRFVDAFKAAFDNHQ